jgi:hypothetical protein
MKPSDIFLSTPSPLVDTFSRTVREFAAALLVFACRDAGDAWVPILPRNVGEAMMARVAKHPWIEFSLRFCAPDFDGLIDQGDAEWVGVLPPGEDERKRPIQFTEQGLRKLRESRWNLSKSESSIDTSDQSNAKSEAT